MATHSSILAWRIPGTEEHGGLPSTGSHRVRHEPAIATASGMSALLLSASETGVHPFLLSSALSSLLPTLLENLLCPLLSACYFRGCKEGDKLSPVHRRSQ